jgi:hypothetical protein
VPLRKGLVANPADLLLEFCCAKLHAWITFTSGKPEVLPRKGLEGRGHRRWPSGAAQGLRPCAAAEPPESPVSGAERRKCAKSVENIRNIKLLAPVSNP